MIYITRYNFTCIVCTYAYFHHVLLKEKFVYNILYTVVQYNHCISLTLSWYEINQHKYDKFSARNASLLLFLDNKSFGLRHGLLD